MSVIVWFLVGATFGWVIVPMGMSRRDKWRTSTLNFFMIRVKMAAFFGGLGVLWALDLFHWIVG